MSGKVARNLCPPGSANDQWEIRRVVFDMAQQPVNAPWVQPSIFTPLFEATPDGKGSGPQTGVVTMHSVAAVRNLLEPTTQIANLAQEDTFPPIAYPSPAGVSSVQRGGLPQYRITFVDGSGQEALVYCDGNTVLALPARFVRVDIMTPPLLFAVVTAGQPADALTPLVGPGLIVEADAAAHVSWGLRDGHSAPEGECTYSQVTQNTLGQTTIFFERPPFAKRVTVIPPLGIGVVISFTTSPALITATPPGVANTIQASQPVPAVATHVRVDFPIGAAPGLFTHCIWQIGT